MIDSNMQKWAFNRLSDDMFCDDERLAIWGILVSPDDMADYQIGLLSGLPITIVQDEDGYPEIRLWVQNGSRGKYILGPLGLRSEKKKPYRRYLYVETLYRILRLDKLLNLHGINPNIKDGRRYHKRLQELGISDNALIAHCEKILRRKINRSVFLFGKQIQSLDPAFNQSISSSLGSTAVIVPSRRGVPDAVLRAVAASQDDDVLFPHKHNLSYAKYHPYFKYNLLSKDWMRKPIALRNARKQCDDLRLEVSTETRSLYKNFETETEHLIDACYYPLAINCNHPSGLYIIPKSYHIELPRGSTSLSLQEKKDMILIKITKLVENECVPFELLLPKLDEILQHSKNSTLQAESSQRRNCDEFIEMVSDISEETRNKFEVD